MALQQVRTLLQRLTLALQPITMPMEQSYLSDQNLQCGHLACEETIPRPNTDRSFDRIYPKPLLHSRRVLAFQPSLGLLGRSQFHHLQMRRFRLLKP